MEEGQYLVNITLLYNWNMLFVSECSLKAEHNAWDSAVNRTHTSPYLLKKGQKDFHEEETTYIDNE